MVVLVPIVHDYFRGYVEGDLPDLIRIHFSKPQIAIRPAGDTERIAAGSGNRKLSDRAGDGDSPDLIPK